LIAKEGVMEILIGVLVLVTLIVGSVVIVRRRRVSIGGRTLDDARHEAYRHPEVGGGA
jgi:hypothetical protein